MNFLTGEELCQAELLHLISSSIDLKYQRRNGEIRSDLKGKNLVMIFDKPSLRTRLSFAVAMTELGGQVFESLLSTRKTEEPEDTIRVLAGYTHIVAIRTHEHTCLERMAPLSPIPIINSLSELHHPCQVLADLMTLQEAYGALKGLHLTYIGDGNNMLHSLLLLAPYLGINLHYACPQGYEPNSLILKQAKERAQLGRGSITAHSNPQLASQNSHALYTDVWTSMGFECEQTTRERAFQGYQLNESLLELAAPRALIMHCMPMQRGREISENLPDHPQSVIFQQSENRLHVQKTLLLHLLLGQSKKNS